MSKESSSSGGIGFVGMLTVLFIALKLLGKVDWSWWWVLSPAWITASIVLGIIVMVIYFEAKEEAKKKSKPVEKSPQESKFMKKLNDLMEEKNKANQN